MKTIFLILLILSSSVITPQNNFWKIASYYSPSGIVYSGSELITNDIDRNFELGSSITQNADFESAITGFLVTVMPDGVASLTRNTSSPITGSGDALLAITSVGTNSLRPTTTVSTFPTGTQAGKYYNISFNYKINSGTVVFAGYWNGSNIFGGATLSGTSKYQFRLYNASVVANALTHYWNGTNLFNVQIDNYDIKQSSYYTPTGNHSFDSSAVYKNAGTYSGKIVSSAAGNGTTNTISLASTLFTAVTNGTNYRFQVYAYTSTASTILTFKLGDIVKTAIISTSGMVAINFDFKATASTTGNIILYLDKAATVYIDDVSLKSGQ